MTFLESFRRQREIGEEVIQKLGDPTDRPAPGAGDRLALRSLRQAVSGQLSHCSRAGGSLPTNRSSVRTSPCPTQYAGTESDGRDGVHRAGRRAEPEGPGQGRRRAGDRRQPVPQHAARQGGGHPGDRGEPDRLLPEPGPARVPRGGRAVRQRPSSGSTRRPRTSWSPRGRSRSSSTSPRRCSTRATACWSSAPTSRPTSRTSSARARRRAGAAAGRERVPAPRSGRRAVPGHRPEAPGRLPELAAQPDRGRRHPRGPRGDRRRRAGDRADGLLRRALLPHGLARPARVDPGASRGCSSTRWRPTPSASPTA